MYDDKTLIYRAYLLISNLAFRVLTISGKTKGKETYNITFPKSLRDVFGQELQTPSTSVKIGSASQQFSCEPYD